MPACRAGGIHHLDRGLPLLLLTRRHRAGFDSQRDAALERLQSVMGKRLGDGDDPLLVSVRSGARPRCRA
jgi:hypothetical protein